MTDDDNPVRRPSARAKASARATTASASPASPKSPKSPKSARARARSPRARVAGPAAEPGTEPAAEPATEASPPASRARPAPRPTKAAAAARPSSEPPQLSAGDDVVVAEHADGAVVITGICGRMGRLLTRRLHRQGPVVGIDRRPFPGKPEDVVHHRFELRRRKAREIFRAGGIKAVVHLGTMHNLRESDKAHHSFNVVGFQKLLGYLSQYRVQKLVVLSSATLYGPSPDNPQFLTEDAPLLGAQEFSQIRDLVEVDMLAQSFFWKHPDVETVILRPCHILGRTRNAPSNYARMERPITVMGFDPMMQVIHERDVIEAIILSLSPGVRGVYNIRGPGEVSVSRMVRMLGKKPTAVPGPLLKGVLSRMWSYRAGGFPTPELDHLRYICMVDDSRARREMGFEPRYTLPETLRAVYSER